jgi:hypothetical protein
MEKNYSQLTESTQTALEGRLRESVMSSTKDDMIARLEERKGHELNRARANHWTAMILMIVAILASGVAGIGGLSGRFGPVLTGAIALIPSVCALLSQQIKFQGKSIWHYRKLRALDALERQLSIETPNATEAEVAAVSKLLTELDSVIDSEWERDFVQDWGWVKEQKDKAKGRATNQTTESKTNPLGDRHHCIIAVVVLTSMCLLRWWPTLVELPPQLNAKNGSAVK